jgi:hypothetical protein
MQINVAYDAINRRAGELRAQQLEPPSRHEGRRRRAVPLWDFSRSLFPSRVTGADQILPVKDVSLPLKNCANPLKNGLFMALRRQRSGVRIPSGAPIKSKI